MRSTLSSVTDLDPGAPPRARRSDLVAAAVGSPGDDRKHYCFCKN
jgi:hypothetical protein